MEWHRALLPRRIIVVCSLSRLVVVCICDVMSARFGKRLKNCKTYSCRVTISTPEQREGLRFVAKVHRQVWGMRYCAWHKTKKTKGKERKTKERRTKNDKYRRKNDKYPSMHPIVTRATNAARVRPEDDSTYVTTSTKPAKGKYEVGIRVFDFTHRYRQKLTKLTKLTKERRTEDERR